eukprot:GHVU01180589.1.p1 GENE.GHVU01180589.1~~GHVU01180589.1.p1  ORF type:complete len:128 (-),score=4.13 GHVU01180589.1:290-625(-)
MPETDDNTSYYSNYDYSYYEDIADVNETRYKCYVCTFTIWHGHSRGQENCRDPFNKANIYLFECPGPCAKIYHRSSETDYLVHRNCYENCRPHQQQNEYIECCTGDFCNGT